MERKSNLTKAEERVRSGEEELHREKQRLNEEWERIKKEWEDIRRERERRNWGEDKKSSTKTEGRHFKEMVKFDLENEVEQNFDF